MSLVMSLFSFLQKVKKRNFIFHVDWNWVTSDEWRVTTWKKSIVFGKNEKRDITRDISVADTRWKDTIIKAHHCNSHYQRDILVVSPNHNCIRLRLGQWNAALLLPTYDENSALALGSLESKKPLRQQMWAILLPKSYKIELRSLNPMVPLVKQSAGATDWSASILSLGMSGKLGMASS